MLDADHQARDLREQRRPIAFAARHIDHVEAGHERAGKQIAVVVLDLHLAADGGGQSLAGEGVGMLRRLAAKDVAHRPG